LPQNLHISLAPVCGVHIGMSVELQLIISQVCQESCWLNFYTQIALRNKTVKTHSLSSKSTASYCFWLLL